ncbi:hypothetical protein Tco_1152746 [Tanacetum coccineum]
MEDNRTMAQLLEAPTEGYEDAIVVPEINANNFEIKHGLLNLFRKQTIFLDHDKEDSTCTHPILPTRSLLNDKVSERPPSDQISPPSPICEINVPEEIKSSCEDPPDLELKDLPSHLEYAFLEGDDKLPVIIAKT